jgi:hypothetical protein
LFGAKPNADRYELYYFPFFDTPASKLIGVASLRDDLIIVKGVASLRDDLIIVKNEMS